MAVLCGMLTIQYSAQSARLSVHKLFTYCIQTRHNVTWLNSQWWLACLRLSDINVICCVLNPHPTCPKNLQGVRFVYGLYWPGEWLEFIPPVKIKTRNPVEGSFRNEFSAICNHCGVLTAWSRKTLTIFEKYLCFGKNDPYAILAWNCMAGTVLWYRCAIQESGGGGLE